MEWQRRGRTRRWRRNVRRWWRYHLSRWESGLRCCDVRCCGVVVLMRVILVVSKMTVGYSDGTSEHDEWFEGGRRSVYKERLFGVGEFPFLLSLLIPLYSKKSTTLTQPWFLFCLDSLNMNFTAPCPDYDVTLLLAISPMPDRARYSQQHWPEGICADRGCN